jgi:hypothetical protein
VITALAAKEGRFTANCDVPGTYLNAEMLEKIHMFLEPSVAKFLCELNPKHKEFMKKHSRQSY